MRVHRFRITVTAVQVEATQEYDYLPRDWEAMSPEQREGNLHTRMWDMVRRMVTYDIQDLEEVEL